MDAITSFQVSSPTSRCLESALRKAIFKALLLPALRAI